MYMCLELLEVIASLPVPEMHASIVPYMNRGRKGEGRVSMGRVYTVKEPIPPDTRTLSELTVRVLISAWWPVKFCRKFPSGSFQILMLSDEAEVKQNL